MGRGRIRLAAVLAAGGLVAAWPAGATPLPTLPIPDTQASAGLPAFVGSPVVAQPLVPKPESSPWVRTMHGDTDDTNTSNYPGPLGSHAVTRSTLTMTAQFFWDSAGRLTVGSIDPTAGLRLGLAAVDPATMQTLAQWYPPTGQTLNLPYTYIDGHDGILTNTKQGHLYQVQRADGPNGPVFALDRDVDVHGYLQPGEQLLNSAYDTHGNIWFTSGAIHNVDQNPGTTTTVGYVDPQGHIVAHHLSDQIDEKGITVHGDIVYMLTAPAGAADHPHDTGTFYAWRASRTGPVPAWQARYEAGSGVKPGGFTRGAGTTPSVLGDRYVGVVDNADNQVHLLVYRQSDGALMCRTPLFAPGSSYTDIGAIGYEQGTQDSYVLLNGYRSPSIGPSPYAPNAAATTITNLDGPNNNMSGMTPGVERIDVHPNGCTLAWHTPERIKSVPVLSTRTGLIYGYTQDPSAAAEGRYVWYLEAIDFRTGKPVWKIRAGAGGAYNDKYQAASLGPDGTLYQNVTLGVVTLKDAK
jgi:hypothetical protein